MTTTKRLRIVVAINPAASFGRHRPVGPSVIAALEAAGHDVDDISRDSFSELLTDTRRAVATRPDVLVVVGGDGMVSLGVGLVAETGISLGLVPAGTGNDMARALGIPHDDPAEAVSVLVAAVADPSRRVDALRVTRADASVTWVAGGVSAGFDALVNDRANRMHWPRGRARYDIALALELIRLRRIDYRLVIDGVASETAGTLVTAGNARSVGGGITLLPGAIVDDGLLDVLVVDRLSRYGFLRLFPRVAKGTHTEDPRVRVTRASRVRIEAAGVVAYGDGERIGELPVDVEIVPGALLIVGAAASTS